MDIKECARNLMIKNLKKDMNRHESMLTRVKNEIK